MVFSLFRRRGKSTAGGLSDTDPAVSSPSTMTGFEMTTVVDDAKAASRAAARRTAEKIDQIEKEVIADALTTIGRYRDPDTDEIIRRPGARTTREPASGTTPGSAPASADARRQPAGLAPAPDEAGPSREPDLSDEAMAGPRSLGGDLDFESDSIEPPPATATAPTAAAAAFNPGLPDLEFPAALPGKATKADALKRAPSIVHAAPPAVVRAPAPRAAEPDPAAKAVDEANAAELRNAIRIPDGFAGIVERSDSRMGVSPAFDMKLTQPVSTDAGDDDDAGAEDFPSTIIKPAHHNPGSFKPGAHVVGADFSSIMLHTGALEGGVIPPRSASAPVAAPAPTPVAAFVPTPVAMPAPTQAAAPGHSAASLFDNRAGSGAQPLTGFSAGSASSARLAEQAALMDAASNEKADMPAGFDEAFLSFDDLATGTGDDALVASPPPVRDPARDPRSAADGKLAIDIIDGSLPGQLEEAAILYSNGQHEPTVDALKLAVEDQSLSAAHTMLAWQMLFDLYRVMGERDSFDALAIRYADTFESSPPAWSDDLRYPERRDPNRRKASPSHVIAAGELDAGFAKYVEQLLRAANHKRQCSLDFSELTRIDAAAAGEFTRLIEGFREIGHPLVFIGLENLAACATAQIESGRADADQSHWKLALLSLRLMGAQERFDDLSIEYCVTYEVSPPPWQTMPSSFTQGDQAGQDEPARPEAEAVAPAAPIAVGAADEVVFEGDLAGRIADTIKALRQVAETNELVRIDCRRLRRVDFAASGELLNELAKLQGAGRRVQFIEPNFLVYALMLVMGIHEMAQIRRRKL